MKKNIFWQLFELEKVSIEQKLADEIPLLPNITPEEQKIKDDLKHYDCIEIGTVKNAFDGYINYLEET